MKRTKTKYSKKIVTGISLFLVIFVVAVLVVYWHTGSEPTALVAAVFGAALGEFWQLAGIKKAEIRQNKPKETEEGE